MEWPCQGPDVKGRARPGPNIFVPFCGLIVPAFICFSETLMEFQENILGLIGNTPLVKLNRLARDIKAQLFAKMENLNPGYSVKDRIGVAMIEAAEREGILKPGGTVIEATSG